MLRHVSRIVCSAIVLTHGNVLSAVRATFWTLPRNVCNVAQIVKNVHILVVKCAKMAIKSMPQTLITVFMCAMRRVWRAMDRVAPIAWAAWRPEHYKLQQIAVSVRSIITVLGRFAHNANHHVPPARHLASVSHVWAPISWTTPCAFVMLDISKPIRAAKTVPITVFVVQITQPVCNVFTITLSMPTPNCAKNQQTLNSWDLWVRRQK